MASKSSVEYYSNIKELSPVRAIAETLMNNHLVRKVDIREAYELAKKSTRCKCYRFADVSGICKTA